MNVLSTVSNQWATRPDDQRFLDIHALHTHVSNRRNTSRVHDMALEHMHVETTETGDLVLGSEAGPMGALTHYSFGQLATRAKAPAGYLRSLPAELARINLQWGLESASEGDDGKVLVRENGIDRVAAITSPSYGRIWDNQLTEAVLNHVDLERWKIPGASYAAKDPKRATTLYASDRDVFLFLVDESNPITVGDETLFRGFYAWNSEVGSATFGIATFLYRFVCDNRNIWGPQDFKEIKIRHTSGGPHRFMHAARPQLAAYVESDTRSIVQTVRNAQAREIGRDKKSVTEWLKNRGFTGNVAGQAYENAERDGLNPRSIWGVVQGLTEQGHAMKHTDERAALERRAGSLLDIAAA